jgi:hexosaminidase
MMPIRALIVMFLMPMFVFAGTQPSTQGTSTINVMPLPASVKLSTERLKLYVSFTVGTSSHNDTRLEKAIVRMQHRLRRRTGLPLLLGLAPVGTPPTLTVAVKEAGSAYPKFGEDESYTLAINSEHAALSANTVVGAMRGLETFSQFVTGDVDGYYFPAVNIDDRPRFPWRGLMIDVGRHFEAVDVIKRNIDGMATVKMKCPSLAFERGPGFPY